MSYRPEYGDALVFNLTGAPSYVPDDGDDVTLDHISNVDVPVLCITSSSSVKQSSIFPHLGVVAIKALSLLQSTEYEALSVGLGVTVIHNVPSLLSVESTIIGRGNLSDLIPCYINARPINIAAGPISFAVDLLSVSSTPLITRSTIFNPVNLLSFGLDSKDSSVLPGAVAFELEAIDVETSAVTFDAIYTPIKGLGELNIVPYHAQVNDNTDNNGGVISNRRIVNTTKSLFPPIPKDLIASGCTLYRKIFWRNNSIGKANLLGGVIYIDRYPSNASIFTLMRSGYTDTQDSLTGQEREYGCGVLLADVAIGDTTISVSLKSSLLDVFKDEDTIVLKSTYYDERFDGILASKVDDIVTITLPSPTKRSYKTGELVSSCVKLNTVSAHTPRVVCTSTLGSFDNVSFPIESQGNGVIKDSWSILFTSSTEYTCNNLNSTISINGDIYTDISPINPITGTPYFILDHRAFKGVFAEGDNINFNTIIVCVAVWVKLVILPASMNSIVNRFSCAVQGLR